MSTDRPSVVDGNTDDPQFTVEAPPNLGFLILYHQTTKALLKEHSAVIKTYLALGTFTNHNGMSFPSQSTLAEMVGMDRATVNRAIARLENLALIEVREKPGHPCLYRLKAPHEPTITTCDPQITPPVSNDRGCDPQITGGVISTSHEQYVTNKRDKERDILPPSIPPSEQVAPWEGQTEEQADDGTSVSDNGSRAQSVSNERTRVSNSNDSEMEHPYWAEHPASLQIIEFWYESYPKKTTKLLAMTRYREIVVPMLRAHWEKNQNDELANSMTKALQWQIQQWDKEGRETKFIPSLYKWIERQSWQDAPQEVWA